VWRRQMLEISTRVAEGTELKLELPEHAKLVDVLGFDWSIKGSTIRVPLDEIGPGEAMRVTFALEVTCPKSKAALEMGALRLDYSDTINGGERSSVATLLSMVTADRHVVDRNVDSETIPVNASGVAAKNATKVTKVSGRGTRH
jgi:hypothetical protein